MFNHKKLIGRDEKGRFMSNKDMSDLERIKEEMMEEMKLKQKLQDELNDPKGAQSGGDSTLNIKNFTKSLKDLAGGDDSIFAIIDDRSDVWMQEVKNNEGVVQQHLQSKNLILIPPYFYWNNPRENRDQKVSFIQDLSLIAKEYDLDLSLIMHLKFLDRVHDNFYAKTDKGQQADIK